MWKKENNSTLENILLICNRNAELLRLVGATFDSKVASLRSMEEKFDNSEKFGEKKFAIFCFICLSLLTFELSNINWKSSEKCNMFTERTYMTVLHLKLFSIYNNLHFYSAIINWNIELNNGVYGDLRNNSACLNTVSAGFGLILYFSIQSWTVLPINLFIYLLITITNYMLILYELSNLDHVLGVSLIDFPI